MSENPARTYNIYIHSLIYNEYTEKIFSTYTNINININKKNFYFTKARLIIPTP